MTKLTEREIQSQMEEILREQMDRTTLLRLAVGNEMDEELPPHLDERENQRSRGTERGCDNS